MSKTRHFDSNYNSSASIFGVGRGRCCIDGGCFAG